MNKSEEKIRLNKYLSRKGICSRRAADALIEKGEVLVNGIPAETGMQVSDSDEIKVSGTAVTGGMPEKVVIAVNKPVGIVCTARSFHGEENIVDLVSYPERLYPVGRLDKDSEGLIFLTNDGDFAKEVTKAAGRHEKEYEVTVDKDLGDTFMERMKKGIYLRDLQKKTSPCKVRKTGKRKFTIILTQGLNRQIRRMCETLGYQVVSLRRVRIMNITLGEMKTGEYREIKGKEKQELYECI